MFKGKKVEGIPATREGAVDWLTLERVDGSKEGRRGPLRLVFRVETVGGKAGKDCGGKVGGVEVPYSTQYWFYG